MSNYPEVLINNYVWEKFRINKPSIYAEYPAGIKPIFPFTDSRAGDQTWQNKAYIIYDSFIRPRTGQYKYFYPIKSGQLVYSIRGDNGQLFEWRDFITDVLDREDVVAAEVNNFSASENASNKIHFQCFNVYQTLPVGQTTKDVSLSQQLITNLIIRYDYHTSGVFGE
jgi:hypothetical protein